MSAMLRASLETYPVELASGVAVALFGLFFGMLVVVFRTNAKKSFEYASRLPLDQEEN